MKLADLRNLFLAAPRDPHLRRYMIQHNVCGHVGGTSADRSDMERLQEHAVHAGKYAWRVRILEAGLDLKATCALCKPMVKTLRKLKPRVLQPNPSSFGTLRSPARARRNAATLERRRAAKARRT